MRCLDKTQAKIAALQDSVYNLRPRWRSLGEFLKMEQPAPALSEQGSQLGETGAGRQVPRAAQFIGKQAAFDKLENHGFQYRHYRDRAAHRTAWHALEL